MKNEQLKAVILGHAIGDAIGVPVEFCAREELQSTPVTEMLGWGTYPVPAGAWSDDTSMALATLDSLKNGRVDWEEIMQNFVAWATKDAYTPTGKMFDIGGTCLSAITRYLEQGRGAALTCGETGERANGNGSLMRIHPVCLYAYAKQIPTSEAITLVEQASALTHAHKRSQIACGIYAFVLWEMLSAPDKSAIPRGLARAKAHYASEPEYAHFKRLTTIAEYTASQIKSTGYVVDTLEAALWSLLTTESYKDCVLTAVNLGEDTDTVAAIAGGLAGALYGQEGIPQSWNATLLCRDYIEELCDAAYAAWTCEG